MPKTKSKPVARKNIRIPKSIVDEVDGIVRDYGLYINRQQFIESAIREKIEGVRSAESKGKTFWVGVKEAFLAHAVAEAVKGESMPSHHLDWEDFGIRIKRYIKERAEREGRKITKRRIDQLTKEILEYHQEILEGLNIIGS